MALEESRGTWGEAPVGQDSLRDEIDQLAAAAAKAGTSVSVNYQGDAYTGALISEQTKVRDAHIAVSGGHVLLAYPNREGGYNARSHVSPWTEGGRFRQFLRIILSGPLPQPKTPPAPIKGRRFNYNDNTDDPTSYLYALKD